MARFTRLIESLSESFRRGRARSLVYFHTDHFEPWRSMAGRIDISEPNAEDIGDFLHQTSQLDYARRLTLFLKPAFRLAPSGGDVRSADGDGLGFRPLTGHETEVHDRALRAIASSGHELQVHLHHEFYTRNAMYATQARYNRDEFQRAYLAEHTTPRQDEARFRLLTEITLEAYRRGSGQNFERWFFVHGMWALNGSDRDVCNIDREIGLLQEMGCLGDFTFPAGRAHTDPVHKAPFLCRSVDRPKCYDLAEAEPRFAYGESPRDRFFIWSSPIKHLYSSIDYYSKEIRASLEDIERVARELVQTSVFLDGTLYLKTHAHSMNTDYFDNIRRPIYPHFHPGVQALLGVVFDAASDAGLDIEFLTAAEVYDRFSSARFDGSTDLASDEHTLRRRETEAATVNAMTALERLEAFGALAASVTHTVVGRRLAQMGETESGCYGYYADLYARETLIHPYEFSVARHLAQTLPDGARIHEFGAGFASMGLLLAVAGFDVLAIDADPRRLATAAAIRAELGRQVPWVAAKLNFKEAAIPAVLATLDCDGVTAVATDVTSGVTLEALGPIVAAVASRYRSVVFDAERFFARTRTDTEMEAVRALFAERYGRCQPLPDETLGRFYFDAGPAEPTSASPPPPPVIAAAPEPAARVAQASPQIAAATLNVGQAARLVDDVGVRIMIERIERQGLEKSGAGAFYAQVDARGRLTQSYDLKVAEWLLATISPQTPILEIGAGVGTLSLILAVMGRRVVALDLDSKRIELGRAIQDALSARLRGGLGNLDFVTARFPVNPPPVAPGSSVAVITNMVFGWDEPQQIAMLRHIRDFEAAVVDADRFGVKRTNADERDHFDSLVREAGMTLTPLELVPDMRFVRLDRRGGRSRLAEGAEASAEIGC